MTAKLSNEFFRFTFSSRDFVAWFRFQFRLPQIPHLGNADLTGVEPGKLKNTHICDFTTICVESKIVKS
jgi:hypothetical protein